MSVTESYNKAMMNGDIDMCITLEQDFGLYGYPPQIVSIGLAAFDAGEDVHQAVSDFFNSPPGGNEQ